MLPRALLVPLLALVGACLRAECPDGERALDGACFPLEAFDEVGNGTPIACADPCVGASGHCDYRTGACVACALDRHCVDGGAPRCDDATRGCAGCLDDEDCASHDETLRCDRHSGRCVACTEATEDTDCGGTSCDVVAGRCTETPPRSVPPCGRCRASSECPRYYACVEYAWGTGEPEQVCLLRFDSAGACATSPADYRTPMVLRASVETVSGEVVEVCRPPTTCAAWDVYRERKPCQSTSECGGPFWSTYCLVPDGASVGRCTMLCLDAKPGYAGCVGGDTCDDGIYCQPPL